MTEKENRLAGVLISEKGPIPHREYRDQTLIIPGYKIKTSMEYLNV